MQNLLILTIFLFAGSFVVLSAERTESAAKPYWKIAGETGIVWEVASDSRLPHADHIEMAGQRVAAIIDYSIDENRQLSLKRDIIFPQLRVFTKTDAPDWRKYRAYLRQTYPDNILPVITDETHQIVPGAVDSVKIAGKLIFFHQPVRGIAIKRTLFPSMSERLFVEKWELQNVAAIPKTLHIGKTVFSQAEKGYKGDYQRKVWCDAEPTISLAPDSAYTFGIYFTARLNDETEPQQTWQAAESGRDAFLTEMQQKLVLRTPEPVLNTLFYFSKIRAAENIFESKMGLVHSPGGGNYYVGVWANDQVEYSGPFFPFLGYENGNVAAENAYQMFLKHIPEDGTPIWSSFEIEGDLTCCGKDRGDAAMIAYGTSQFLLARGDASIARALWPLVEWALDDCHQKRNQAGAIQSDTDEMEGRISTGTANLATSSLYFGGLKFAAHLAEALGKPELAELYRQRAKEMENVIENYFGAGLEGLPTYRYFEGNTHLRHWICLPLVMGINQRKSGTSAALFNHLWTENGVLVEHNPQDQGPKVFWDRGTLYALRGAFKAGATELALDRLNAFSQKRLTGDHVPYVIEAFPENNMRHLSAESALFCRIFTEGLLGIEPTGFKSFTMTPQLPGGWERFSLTRMLAFQSDLHILLERENGLIRVKILQHGREIFNQLVKAGEKIAIEL